MSTSTTTAQTTEEPEASNSDRFSTMPKEMVFEIATRLKSLSDLVRLQCTSRHFYAMSQGQANWADILEVSDEPLDEETSPCTWLAKRLPDFYPAAFVFPRIIAERYAKLPIRGNQEKFWSIFTKGQINYLTALLAVRVESKSRYGPPSICAIAIDDLVHFISQNPRLEFLSVYDSSDQGPGFSKIVRALAKHCPNLKFFYSESKALALETDIFRLVAACPHLEEIALPNYSRRGTLSKKLGWPLVSKVHHNEFHTMLPSTVGETMTSKFKEVRHFGARGGSDSWLISGRDILRRPPEWKGLTVETQKWEDDAGTSDLQTSSSNVASKGFNALTLKPGLICH